MIISWFSSGVSSFIATYLMRDKVDKIMYQHIDDQHKDSLRFVKDCEITLGKKIEVTQSKYMSVNQACLKFGFINGAKGAKCTVILKKRIRKDWERKNPGKHTYIWGIDIEESKKRVPKIERAMPDHNHIFPLVERNLNKQDCHGMLMKLGIKRPKMYDLGYNNNNCIGCVKGGKGYFNKIRRDFPEKFKERQYLEELIGRSCIKGKFLKDLKLHEGRMSKEILEDCNIFCEINL